MGKSVTMKIEPNDKSNFGSAVRALAIQGETIDKAAEKIALTKKGNYEMGLCNGKLTAKEIKDIENSSIFEIWQKAGAKLGYKMSIKADSIVGVRKR